MPTQIYSFFSGVGFLDLGFQNAGFDIAFVDEYDERFLNKKTYKESYPMFEAAFNSTLPPHEWYNIKINNSLKI